MPRGKWTAARDMPDQSGRVAVVTGSNTGIGLETVAALARRGAHVVLACRDQAKGRSAAAGIAAGGVSGTLDVMVLDLADLASVRVFSAAFRDGFDRLDLLINNAGVMWPPASKTVDGFELQFGTNHLGHFALTARLLDRLRKTSGSRVVTVSSVSHRFGTIDFDDLHWESRKYHPNRAYGQSKLANLLFAYELQRRLDRAGIETMSVAAHPGYTGTDLQRYSGFLRLLNPFVAMPTWRGALPTLYAATASGTEPGGYYGPDGFGELRGYPTRVGSSSESTDEAVAAKLWQVSEGLVGLEFAL